MDSVHSRSKVSKLLKSVVRSRLFSSSRIPLTITYTFSLSLVVLALCGCATDRAKEIALQKVARDWCMTIRASQVIPVYPPLEDLQPGDVFLVQKSIKRESQTYREKGFLDLDDRIKRLHPTNYHEYYRGAYGVGTGLDTPHHWNFPSSAGWSNAPRAAFPTYTFEVKRGAGLNLAIPIQGVPVGLNAIGAGRAVGSVSLTECYSYGVAEADLWEQVRAWAVSDAMVRGYGSTRETNFLRVVTRVFLAKGVNVSLTANESGGVQASGGASKEVNLFTSSTNTLENYTNILARLNETLSSSALPGGTLKFASASSRQVNLNETFPRPLVIGYLAYQFPILPGNRLGNPVPTQSLLIGETFLNPEVLPREGDLSASRLETWLNTSDLAVRAQRKKIIQDWLTKQQIDVRFIDFQRSADWELARRWFLSENGAAQNIP